jgi:hypothetical protein
MKSIICMTVLFFFFFMLLLPIHAVKSESVLRRNTGLAAAAQAVKSGCKMQDIDKPVYRNRLLKRGQILEWND